MILSSLCLSACYGKIVSKNYHALAHPNAVQCFSRLNSLDRARDKFLLLIDVRLSSSRLYSPVLQSDPDSIYGSPKSSTVLVMKPSNTCLGWDNFLKKLNFVKTEKFSKSFLVVILYFSNVLIT